MSLCWICRNPLRPTRQTKVIHCDHGHGVHATCYSVWDNGCGICRLDFRPIRTKLRSWHQHIRTMIGLT